MIGQDRLCAMRRASGGGALLWAGSIVLASAVGSLAFACVAPFAGLAAVAAATLPLRRALATVAAVWLANQAIGFGVLHYPWTADTLIWGLFIGIAALAATVAARGALHAASARGALVALGAALAAAFVAQQAALFAVALVMGGTGDDTPAILGQIALLDAAWFAVLVAAHEAGRWGLGHASPFKPA
jgi:hypothetical protein